MKKIGLPVDDVKKHIESIQNYLINEAVKKTEGLIKKLRGIIGELERLLKIAKRALRKKSEAAANSHRIYISVHYHEIISQLTPA